MRVTRDSASERRKTIRRWNGWADGPRSPDGGAASHVQASPAVTTPVGREALAGAQRGVPPLRLLPLRPGRPGSWPLPERLLEAAGGQCEQLRCCNDDVRYSNCRNAWLDGCSAADDGGVGGPVARGQALPGDGDIGADAEGAGEDRGRDLRGWKSAVLRVCPGWIPSSPSRSVGRAVLTCRPGWPPGKSQGDGPGFRLWRGLCGSPRRSWQARRPVRAARWARGRGGAGRLPR